MVRTEKKKFGELEFTTTQFPAMRSMELLTRLVTLVGPAVGSLMDVGADTELDAKAMAALGPALTALSPKDAAALTQELLLSTSVWIPDATGGRGVELTSREKIDQVFTGRLKLMFQVLGFVIQVNFADFIEGSAPAIAPAQKTTALS